MEHLIYALPSANQHCRTVILATEYLWDLLGSLVEPCLWCSCYVYYHQGWRSQSGFGQTTFLASWSHDARVPWRPLCIRVWNCCLWDVTYQIKPFSQLTCPFHVESETVTETTKQWQWSMKVLREAIQTTEKCAIHVYNYVRLLRNTAGKVEHHTVLRLMELH